MLSHGISKYMRLDCMNDWYEFLIMGFDFVGLYLGKVKFWYCAMRTTLLNDININIYHSYINITRAEYFVFKCNRHATMLYNKLLNVTVTKINNKIIYIYDESTFNWHNMIDMSVAMIKIYDNIFFFNSFCWVTTIIYI